MKPTPAAIRRRERVVDDEILDGLYFLSTFDLSS
jgi:hypothetical protein